MCVAVCGAVFKVMRMNTGLRSISSTMVVECVAVRVAERVAVFKVTC